MVERGLYRVISYIRKGKKRESPQTPNLGSETATEKADNYYDAVQDHTQNLEACCITESIQDTILRLWGKQAPLSDFSGIDLGDVKVEKVSSLLLYTLMRRNGTILAHLLAGLVSQIWSVKVFAV